MKTTPAYSPAKLAREFKGYTSGALRQPPKHLRIWSSEHNAKYVPYFLEDDRLIDYYDVLVDEYVRHSEANLIEYQQIRRSAR